VIGHHPVYTAGERSNNPETALIRSVLQPLFDRYNVTAYLSGHEHNLQHLRGSEGLHQFVSGAGSESRLTNPFVPRRFARAAPGFMLVSVLKSQVIVQFISRSGRVLYRYRILPGEAGK
jgi:tartrate-resistant acid phosphatase type 5